MERDLIDSPRGSPSSPMGDEIKAMELGKNKKIII